MCQRTIRTGLFLCEQCSFSVKNRIASGEIHTNLAVVQICKNWDRMSELLSLKERLTWMNEGERVQNAELFEMEQLPVRFALPQLPRVRSQLAMQYAAYRMDPGGPDFKCTWSMCCGIF